MDLLHDILSAIEAIETYAVSTYKLFLEDEKTQDAIMYNLIVMGKQPIKYQRNFKLNTRKFLGHPLSVQEM